LNSKGSSEAERKSWKKSQRELTITTSDGSQRGFLLLRCWHGACCHLPSLVFGGALVEKESLDWRRFEGKRLGERQVAPMVLFIRMAKRSWPWVVVHILRNLESVEVSLTESL
jgi:hypothetical protein